MTKKELEIRRQVANLLRAAGCDCCKNKEKFDEAEKMLACLLVVPMYKDLSGFDFGQFADKPI